MRYKRLCNAIICARPLGMGQAERDVARRAGSASRGHRDRGQQTMTSAQAAVTRIEGRVGVR